MKRRIAVFGGSFNPPHLGHRKICRYLLDRGFEQVWIVPCYRHAFGKRLAAFEHRFEMCELLFAGLRVRVLDVERRLGGVSRTVKTLAALTDENPGCDLALVVGRDALRETHKWLDFPHIRKLARLVAIPRPGYDERGPFLSAISSTRVREKVASRRDISRDVGIRVARYVREHGLYRRMCQGAAP